MERLTLREATGCVLPGFENNGVNGCYDIPDAEWLEESIDRLAAIEDILGDEYDLDRLRELAQADKEGRCVVLPTKDDIMNTRCCVSCIHFQNLDWCGECVGNSKWEPCKAALRREQDG